MSMAPCLTKECAAVLKHALGLDDTWRIPRHSSRRNHFVTDAPSSDHTACLQLVDEGLMLRRPGNALTGGSELFVVTERGQQVAREMALLNPPPRLTRSQRRYQSFLEHDSGLPFGTWLKHFGTVVQ